MLIYKLFVSGVVLANASLDIAFHDTVLIDPLGIYVPSLLSMATTVSTLSSLNVNDNNNVNNNNNAIDFFDNSSYKSYIKTILSWFDGWRW